MSLRVWLPLNGTLDNQGLDDITTTLSGGIAVNNSGKTGKCYNFDGTNGQLLLTNLDLRGLPQVSFAFWCCPVEDLGGLFQMSVGGTHRFQIGSPSLTFRDSNNSSTRSISYNTTFVSGEWVHIACIYNRGQIIIYINGVQTNRNSTYFHEDSVLYSDLNQYRIGRIRVSTGDVHYNGKLNDFRIYDHALSAMEVKQLSQGLILHYLLNHNGFGNDNLSTDTLGEKNLDKNVKNAYFSPINIYPLSEDARSIILNSQVGDLVTYSFDYEIKNNEVENYQMRAVLKTSGTSFSSSGLQYVYSKGGILPLGDSSGHAEATFKLKQTHKTYGTGWLITAAPNKDSSLNIEAKITHFKFEIGGKATPWCPNPTEIPTDSIFGYNDDIEYDCSGYQRNGTKININYSQDTPKYNVSSVFNSEDNSVIKIPASNFVIQGSQNMTISIWAYMDDWTQYTSRIYSCTQSGGFNIQPSSNNLQWAVRIYTNEEKTQAKYASSDPNLYLTVSKSSLSSGWHMFTWTYTTSGTKIYVDGQLKMSREGVSYGLHFNTTAPLILGGEATASSYTSPYFDGKMSDFRIYSTALSSQDILSLYNNEAYIDNNGNIYGAVYEEG